MEEITRQVVAVSSKRIRGVQPRASDGRRWSVALEFTDGSVLEPPGSIANHLAARACGAEPLPSNAVLFSVLRDAGNAYQRHSDELLNDPGHYSKPMAQLWGEVESTTPGAWRIVCTRTMGVPGSLKANLGLLREAQNSGAHVVLPQPGTNPNAQEILSVVETLRQYQKKNPPPVGQVVDVIPQVPYYGEEDNNTVIKVADKFAVLFVDLHGINEKVLDGLRKLNLLLQKRPVKPWIGATQVPDFTNGPDPILTAPLLNAMGIMACVQRLGKAPRGDMPDGLKAANKKFWPFPNESRGVARADLPPGTPAKAPQAAGLDLTDDLAVDATPRMFDVKRTHLLVEAIHEARELFEDLEAGEVDIKFLQNRSKLREVLD